MLDEGKYTAKYFDDDGQLFERNRQGQTAFIPIEQMSLEERIGCDDKLFTSFLRALLSIDPNERPTAEQALMHPWFTAMEESSGSA